MEGQVKQRLEGLQSEVQQTLVGLKSQLALENNLAIKQVISQIEEQCMQGIVAAKEQYERDERAIEGMPLSLMQKEDQRSRLNRRLEQKIQRYQQLLNQFIEVIGKE